MINEAIDFYDDPTGNVLKDKLPDHETIPEFIKTAERLTPGEMNKLPDDVFALVAFDGVNKLRKFACVDKGNVALSVIYFMENKDKMPWEAQKTAAVNLTRACDWYNLKPPKELEKLALAGAIVPLAGLGLGVAQGHSSYKRRKAAMQAGMNPTQAMTKVNELYGSAPMPVTRPREKTASLEPYVDVTGLKPPVQKVKEAGQRFCLGGKYPIDTAEQVEKAASYFELYGDRFSPFERHQFCVKLASRAGDLGMTLSKEICRYGSTKTAQDAHVGVYQRQRMFREGTSEHSLLDEMKEKCASLRPEVMAKVIEDFDRATGLDQMWGSEIPDPYFTMFGPEKRAEWSFTRGNDYINEERLRRCARECKEELKDHFGEDVMEEFGRDPVQIFDSLPLDHKRIIMRISQAVEE